MHEMLAGRFKAVLFDLGGTLVKHEDGPVIHRRILEDNGIHVSLKAVTRAHSENERELDMNQIPEQGQASTARSQNSNQTTTQQAATSS